MLAFRTGTHKNIGRPQVRWSDRICIEAPSIAETRVAEHVGSEGLDNQTKSFDCAGDSGFDVAGIGSGSGVLRPDLESVRGEKLGLSPGSYSRAARFFAPKRSRRSKKK